MSIKLDVKVHFPSLEYLQCLFSKFLAVPGLNLLISFGTVFGWLASVVSVASLSSHVSSALVTFNSLHSDGEGLGNSSLEGSEADLVPLSCIMSQNPMYLKDHIYIFTYIV